MIQMKLYANDKQGRIDGNLYGHFSEHLGRCVYEGIWVGPDSPIPHTDGIRNDVLEALRRVRVPVLRWPGGCFADEYRWTDGVGPAEKRPRMVNNNWGGVVENNRFGTHEFLRLCELIGAEPYISGNVGSGTVREMQEWVEYMTMNGDSPMANWRRANGRDKPWAIRYFGVGNENWGCGGNMRPEYYADVYRRYQTYVRNYGGNSIFKIACGPNEDNYAWTEVLMREAARFMNGLSLHYYTLPTGNWSDKGDATGFSPKEWFVTLQRSLRMEELIVNHSQIMDRYDPDKKVALIVDEWGTWYNVEHGTNPGFLYQQNTLRDALVAGVNLHLFHRHCDRVRMANLAQIVNVLQALILTEGARMLLTPTYHVFDMFQMHQDADQLRVELESPTYTYEGETIPQLSVSASVDAGGAVHLSACNLSHSEPASIRCLIEGLQPHTVSGRVLTDSVLDAHNTFDCPDRIHPVALTTAAIVDGVLQLTLPPASVVVLELK